MQPRTGAMAASQIRHAPLESTILESEAAPRRLSHAMNRRSIWPDISVGFRRDVCLSQKPIIFV